MSKRRINQQQTNRIQQKQKRHQKKGEAKTTAITNGLVIARFSRHALIEDNQGGQHRCAIRPDVQSLVAGDKVAWQPEAAHHGVVLSIYPRQSVLNRTQSSGTPKPVAANITRVMIVVAPNPCISWTLLDSYLVMTETLQLTACIILNKTDMPCDEEKQRLNQHYQPLGYTILHTEKGNVTHHALLLKTLENQTSVFVGQSGVGKSSIISKLLAGTEDIRTNTLSATSNLGRHTTSNSRLYHLESGGNIIDSPGIREFKLSDLPTRNIAGGFREFHAYIPLCQFRNCNHQNTPGCAVLDAVKKGAISQQRYESYRTLSGLAT